MIQPLRGKLLVEVLDDTLRTASGLYLAGIKDEVPHRGLVIELGLPYRDKKGKEYPWGIYPNHIVHYKRIWDQQKIKHYILKREQIYAIEFKYKAYACADYIIVQKLNMAGGNKIFVPSHFASEVSKQTELADVISVGREDKLGINVGDRLLIYKEGLSVRIPLMPELWALKPRAILCKI